MDDIMQGTPYRIDIFGKEENHTKMFESMLEEQKYFRNGVAYFQRCYERHDMEELEIIIAWDESCGKATGYALLNWQPKYALFKRNNIPEIQDLNVISLYRRQGIGRAIIEFCEKRAAGKGYEEMGIGVGLDSSFGVAQRLYVALGYIPDGSGISYDRKQVAAGEFRPIDENLCLMMSKVL